MIFELAILFVFPAMMALAAAMDLFTMTIPNKIPLLLVAGFVFLAPFSGFDWSQVAWHAGVAAAALTAGFICFAMGWIGGGDAKLFAAAALWFGHQHFLDFAVIAGLLGGALTLVIVLGRNVPLPGILARQGWLARLHDTKEGVPYGIALAAGALIVYPQTGWMAAIA